MSPLRSRRARLTAFSTQIAATSPRCARKSLPSSLVKRCGSLLENTSTPSSCSLRRSGMSARLPGARPAGRSSSWSALLVGAEPGPVEALRAAGRAVVSASTKDTPAGLTTGPHRPRAGGGSRAAGREDEGDVVELVGAAQPVDQALEQLLERAGAQQLQLAVLGLAQQRVVAAGFLGDGCEPRSAAGGSAASAALPSSAASSPRVGLGSAHALETSCQRFRSVHARRSATLRRSSR